MAESQSNKLIAEHTAPIAEALGNLQALLSAFGQALGHAANPAVVFEPEYDPRGDMIVRYRELGAGASRRRAIEALLQIEYGMEDAVNQSVKCHGALGVPKRLISDARIINRAKSEFKDAMRAVTDRRVRVPVKDHQGDHVVVVKELSRVILRRIQRSSINLLAAYREIPLLEETPHSIRLMRTRTRSVPRKTAAQLLNLLADRDDALAMADRERLSTLDPKEYLVSPKERYPRMRAHVFYRRLDASGQAARQIVMGELPVLFPMRATTRPPDITTPAIRQKPRAHPISHIEAEEYVRTHHYRRMAEGHREFSTTKRNPRRQGSRG